MMRVSISVTFVYVLFLYAANALPMLVIVNSNTLLSHDVLRNVFQPDIQEFLQQQNRDNPSRDLGV